MKTGERQRPMPWRVAKKVMRLRPMDHFPEARVQLCYYRLNQFTKAVARLAKKP